MKLHVKNVAKVKEASLALDGITVIAGENNCGKSTIGKVLFGVFDAISDSDTKIVAQKRAHIRADFLNFVSSRARTSNGFFWVQAARYFSRNTKKEKGAFAGLIDLLERNEHVSKNAIIDSFLVAIDELKCIEDVDAVRDDLADVARELADYINIPDQRILKEISNTSFFNIFEGQVNYLGDFESDALIDASINNKNTRWK